MNVSMKSAPASTMALASPMPTSSEQFRTWMVSLEGQKLWGAKHLTITPDGICHALDQVSAVSYGLLISRPGTAILSAINPTTFARLEARYREAAETGLCFWWEGGILSRIDCEAFFSRIDTLPFPPTPRGLRRGHAFSYTRGAKAQQERCSFL